jgi:hypothetical protein
VHALSYFLSTMLHSRKTTSNTRSERPMTEVQPCHKKPDTHTHELLSYTEATAAATRRHTWRHLLPT